MAVQLVTHIHQKFSVHSIENTAQPRISQHTVENIHAININSAISACNQHFCARLWNLERTSSFLQIKNIMKNESILQTFTFSNTFLKIFHVPASELFTFSSTVSWHILWTAAYSSLSRGIDETALFCAWFILQMVTASYLHRKLVGILMMKRIKCRDYQPGNGISLIEVPCAPIVTINGDVSHLFQTLDIKYPESNMTSKNMLMK